MAKKKYPEHEKVHQIHANSQVIGEFLSWLLNEQCYFLCTVNKRDQFVPGHKNIENLLAEYYGIDLDALENEKQSMLASLRKGGR